MATAPDPRSSETALLIVGIVLAFLGAALIALLGNQGGLALAAAVALAVIGLGVLLRVVLRLRARSS